MAQSTPTKTRRESLEAFEEWLSVQITLRAKCLPDSALAFSAQNKDKVAEVTWGDLEPVLATLQAALSEEKNHEQFMLTL